MRSCIHAHFEHARERLRVLSLFAIAVDLVPAIVIGLFAGFGIFVFCAVLFAPLVAAIPAAVWFSDFHGVRKFERRFAENPSIVAGVVYLRLRINGTTNERADVSTSDGEHVRLLLPSNLIEALAEAFPPSRSFEAALARLQG
jgi:hypothetical protein